MSPSACCWKRSNDSDALLQEWINVVATPMMNGDSTRAMEGLQHLSSTSPAPFSQYAAEIAQMYLQRNENKQTANNKSNYYDSFHGTCRGLFRIGTVDCLIRCGFDKGMSAVYWIAANC